LEGALKLLRELAQRQRLFSLSNTNCVQWPKVLEDLGAQDPFHAHYPSHVSGFHKPDRARMPPLLRRTAQTRGSAFSTIAPSMSQRRARTAGTRTARLASRNCAKRVRRSGCSSREF